MTPPGERSIRNVPVSSGSHRRSASRFKDDIPLPRKRKKKSKWLWWGVGLTVICAIAGLLLSTFFEGATVTITPKTAAIHPPANVTALPNAPQGSLGYKTVTLSKSASTEVTASGTTRVSTPATGVITISNTYSAAKQVLVVNTRFEAPDGKMYRIRSAVTIPGTSKNADGSTKPGTVTATIYADQPGESYNRPNTTTFTIPGFKGDSRYTKFSAQSQGPIQGGFVGNKAAVSSADMQKAQDSLKQQLSSALQSGASASIPEGYLPVQGSLAVTYSDIAQAPGSNSKVTLTQTANATVAIVNSANIASVLAKLLVQGYAGEALAFKEPNPLVLQLSSTTSKTTGPLTLLLQGEPILVWQFDQEALKQTLLGKEKSSFEGVLADFAPAIEKAQASIRPFWKATFPKNSSELTIVVKD